MWIVRLALRRPYTFVVAALLIFVLGVVTIVRMPTDIFPEINIPVVSVVWQYNGVAPEEMEQRIVTVNERAFTTTVNDIEHIESQSLTGISVIKVFFQPGAKIEAAVAQLTSVTQTLLRIMPPGITPPLIIRYNASSVPVLQLSVGSDSLAEQELYDYGTNVIRTQLATVQGASVLLPYGGKPRQIMVDIDPQALYAKGLSATDVSAAINAQNLILPSGSAKLGDREYSVRLNASAEAIDALNNLPIREVNGSMVYIRDVAQVHDGFATQTNIVRQDGHRASFLSILKNGGASTLSVVERVKQAIPRIRASLPDALKLGFLFDQSLFVKASIQSVLIEGLIAACLTASMILLFLGSWRSTIIVTISIPLSILCSILALSVLGQTLNIMTLGGLSLAVGILVDDATVEIENIHRNLGLGKPLKQAILDGAEEIAVPALVSTLSICIVFIPVAFLSGAAQSLFLPLGMAVVFAMLASYLLSRTVVPMMADFLLKAELDLYRDHAHETAPSLHTEPSIQSTRQPKGNTTFLNSETSPNYEHPDNRQEEGGIATQPAQKDIVWRVHERFNRQFERFRDRYSHLLAGALYARRRVFLIFVAFWVSAIALLPFVGQDFFPQVDAGQFRMHVRTPTGTRIEATEQIFSQVEAAIREVIPAEEIEIMLDNIGLPAVGINLVYSGGDTISTADGEILVGLKHEKQRSTGEYVQRVREKLRTEFPDLTIYFQPADIVTQILNFGLPAPVDVQIAGPPKNQKANYAIAKQIEAQVRKIPGAVDVHLHQVLNQPELRINVDRTQAQQVGLTQRDVANNLLTTLTSSGQVAPNYWLDPKKGVSYLVAVQVPSYKIDSIETLESTPITNSSGTANGSVNTSNSANSSANAPQLLSNLATVQRGKAPQVINHYNVQPVYDVYANVQGRDLGGVAHDIYQVIAEQQAKLPKGSVITVRGQVETMNASFLGLGVGIVFAIALVYCLMVVNFQSWVDPFIIMMALPNALSGIIWMLFVTQTTFSVPSLMGAIMTIGVATANSILLVTFANDQRELGVSARSAALTAGFTRLRPVIMTALAMIVGMLPMSLGLGEGGEQNAPLGRAVIGGLLAATSATLVFVPVVYSLLRYKQPTLLEPKEQHPSVSVMTQ